MMFGQCLAVCLQQVKKLQAVCTELERQVTDYESLNQSYEDKQREWTRHRCVIDVSVTRDVTPARRVRQLLLWVLLSSAFIGLPLSKIMLALMRSCCIVVQTK